MKSTIGERGQITIPKEIRERLGVTPGMQLEVREEEGKIVLVKSGIEEAIAKWKGSARNPYGTTDELLNTLRDGE